MSLIKRNWLIVLVSIMITLSLGLLFGCGGDKAGGENPVTLGNGTIVTNEEDGVTKYTAVPEEWNVFSGWFDGMLKYSNNETIIVDKDTPDGLVAKFETSGTLAVNRILNGSYYRYQDLTQTEGEYFNMNYDTTLSIQGTTYSVELDVSRGGYFSLDGKGFHDYAVVKDGEEVLFSQYYVDDANDAMLYLDYGDRKVAVEDFESAGSFLVDFPSLSQNVWTLKNLLNNKVYSWLDGYIGFRNAVGFIQNVENSKNQTKIVLKVDALLNDLKDKISALDDEEYAWLKNAVKTLTSQYEGIANKLPTIVFEVAVDYQTIGGQERISKVTFKANFKEAYNFALGDNLFTIPACTMSCVIENANMKLENTPNGVPVEIINSFPEAVHAVNVHADASLYFLKENVATLELGVLDEYKIEFDADINARAVVDAIGKDGELDESKIDWNNLGFLSLKISLIENPEDSKQSSRHNGENEYLNLLVDTNKYGAKAFVYVGLYNPKTLNGTATSNYIISGVYDIPALVKFMPEIVDSLESVGNDNGAGAQTLSNMQKQNIVASLLSSSVKGAFGFIEPEISEDEIMFQLFLAFLKKIAPTNQVVQDGLTFSEFGSTLAIEEVKDLIEEKFAQTDDVLSSLGLQNNLFGNNTTHIAIKSGEARYGAVVKNTQDEYIDANGKVFVDEYNASHKMLIGVADGSIVTGGLDDGTFTKEDIENEVKALKGKSLTIENGLYSDGSTSSTFENCQGNQAKLAMRVFRAEYELTGDNTAQITVYLSFSAGTLQSLLVGTLDIPYGLISYTTQITLN